MKKPPRNNDSIEFEPHLRNSQFETDPSEEKAGKLLSQNKPSEYEEVEHSVWDEPALDYSSPDHQGGKSQFANWLKGKIASTSAAKSWLHCLFLIFLSGLWAVVGAFTLAFKGEGVGIGVLLAIVVFAPVVEEVLKISLPLLTIEKKPFLFKSSAQIFLCCAFSGLFFAVIENLLYLNVYIEDPSELIVIWRWTICVLLHTSCASISSLGLISVWKRTVCEFRKPELGAINKYLTAAVIIHSAYNILAVSLESFGVIE